MSEPTRELARKIALLQRDLRRLSTQPQLGHSSFEGGAIQEYDPFSEQLVQVIGEQWDGTHTVATFNGPPPPIPANFTLEPLAGAVRVSWDGEFEPDAAGNMQVSPMDWIRAEVHVSTSPDFDTNLTATLMTTFDTPRGGSKDVAIREPGVQYVRLVSRSQSGKRSPDSVTLAVEVGWELALPPTTTPVGAVVESVGALHIFWPVTANPSGYDVQVHITTDDTPPTVDDPSTLAKTTRGTIAIVDRMPDGSDLQQDVQYRVWLIATNTNGSANVTGPMRASLRKINTPDIAADAAWIGTMSVDQLTGGTMRSETVVGGGGGIYAEGVNGERAGIFPTGIKVSGGAAVNYRTYIDFPTNGAPNIVSGILRATTLEVGGDAVTGRAMNLRGRSELAQGGELRMASAPQSPISGPIVTDFYPSIQMSAGIEPEPNFSQVRGGWWDAANSLFYFVDGTQQRVYWMNAAGIVQGSKSLLGLLRWESTSGAPTVTGITRAGGSWHILHTSMRKTAAFGQAILSLAVTRFSDSWAPLAVWYPNVGYSNYARYSAMGTDGTNVIVGCRNSDEYFRIASYSATVPAESNGASSIRREWSVQMSETGWLRYGNYRSIVGEQTDLPAGRLVLVQTNRVLVWSTNVTPRIESEEWPLEADAAAVWWAGSGTAGNFYSLSQTGSITKYSGLRPIGGSKAHFANTLYMPTTTSDYETAMGPITSYSMTPRAWLKVTASYAGAPGTRIYGVISTTAPSRVSLRLQDTLMAPEDTRIYGAGLNLTAANPPLPTDRPFPAAQPAQIVSDDGSTFWKANGDAKLRKMIVTSPTDVTALGGNEPALRVGDVAGWHLRMDGNQIQAMVNDDAVKTLALNIEADANGDSGGLEIGRGSTIFKKIRAGSRSVTANAAGNDTIPHGGGTPPDIVTSGKRRGGTNGTVEFGAFTDATMTVYLSHNDGTPFTSGQTSTVDWIAMWL